jgi:chloride channel 3/4/5
MIWSNGFPFLDNKEDHVFNVPVSQAMTSNPLSLPASDFPVREVEHLLNDNKFQGFPIIENRTSKILVGYIGRTELRYAVDRARRGSLISPNARCVFSKEAAAAMLAQGGQTPSVISQDVPQTFDELEDAAGAQFVDFTPYVDHTPLSVHPRLPLETVMELFKKMGPRVILVEHRGRIVGLVTVKDCLKYQFKVEAQENALAAGPGPGLTNGNGNGHIDDHSAGTFEEKLWDFLQQVGQTLRLVSGSSRVRLPGSSQSGGRTGGISSGVPSSSTEILEGTEIDDERGLELEERR